MMRVGLIGPADRKELIRLAIRLEERGADPVILDARANPTFRIAVDGSEACGVELDSLSAVFVSDLRLPSYWSKDAEGRCDPEGSERALRSSRRHLAAWNAVLERLARRIPVVNPPRTHDLHALKPWELTLYERDGLPAPQAVATSDPRSLSGLAGLSRTGWVSKGMCGGYGYTESFTLPADAKAAARELQIAPLMVQERIEGDNVRAFVLDGEMIGAAETINIERDATDSRRGEIRVGRVALPDEAARTAVAAAARCGMPYCAVDFMREEASGRYLLLECNSSPFFVNFERLSGCDISGAIADYLVGRRRSRSGESAEART
jgi:glutathione synthase/RimK-type ligase-like ATP-grasp enzyme